MTSLRDAYEVGTLSLKDKNGDAYVCCQWKIPDFLTLVQNPNLDYIRSHDFSFASDMWEFSLDVQNIRQGVWKSPFLKFFVGKHGHAEPFTKLSVHHTVNVRTSEGAMVLRAEASGTENHFHPCFNMWKTVLDFSSVAAFGWELQSTLTGSLIIEVTMKLFPVADDDEGGASTTDIDLRAIPYSVVHLRRDFGVLLESGNASDATVSVLGHQFRVHRAILAARSPVFAAMFDTDMAEKKSGLVEIKDCHPDTFRRFLQYIYTGDIEDSAIGLYKLAVKYQMEPLKIDCVRCIRRDMTVDTFVQCIRLWTEYEDSELKRFAVRFFGENILDVLKSSEWEVFLVQHPKQANELVIQALVTSNESRKRRKTMNCGDV